MNRSSGSPIRLLILALLAGFSGIFSVIPPGTVSAQPVIVPENLSLGGGGTAYLTGVEANFYNPANLMIRDREGTTHFSIGNTGLFFEPVLSLDQPNRQAKNFRDIFSTFREGSQELTPDQQQALLQENYPGNTLTSQHQTRTDITLGGIYWQKEDRAFSIVLRSRFASRIEVGRGWYSLEFVDIKNGESRDFTLVNQSQTLHEISAGFAREFTYINGLIPRINKLYVGIAPKFVIGGAYRNAEFEGGFERQDNTQQPVFTDRFGYRSSGGYSDTIDRYRRGTPLQTAVDQNLSNAFFLEPTGYGVGFDFGLTYLMPLGKSTAILDSGPDRRPVKKSLRFAFSVTDLGIISYSNSPLQLSSSIDSTLIVPESTQSSKFIGAPGQYPFLFEHAEQIPNPFLTADGSNRESFSELLPTSFNFGTALDLDRLKLTGDLTLGLNNTAFNTTKLTAHLGLELRPHRNVPLRIGSQLAAGLPTHFGLGTGFESRDWDLLFSTQILVKSRSLTTEVIGGGITTLRFHF